jgi:WD40 repeat protein
MQFLGVLIVVAFAMVLRGHPVAAQSLFEQATLVVDPGKHTGRINSVAVSKSGKFAVSGSFDKTIRIWSLDGVQEKKGTLKHTVRMPAGEDNIGKIYAVAISPQDDLVAAGGWTSGNDEPESIYLFDPDTLKIITRISVTKPVDAVNKLTFSADGRYLAAAIGTEGLRIYDKDKHWEEIFRDEDYGHPCDDDNAHKCAGAIYGLSFATDGRLATASYDKKVRLYSPGPDFKFVVAPRELSAEPYEIAFRPGANVLAVGYASTAVALLDGHDLHALPSPNIADLNKGLKLGVVAWSRDGSRLYVGGGSKVFVWDDAGLGQRRTLPGGDDTVISIATSPDGCILVAAGGPLLRYMDSEGHSVWLKTTPIARFGSQSGELSVSRDGSIVDFGHKMGGGARIRFDMKSLTLTPNPPADNLTVPPRTEGLPIKNWRNDTRPTFDGKIMDLEESEESRSLAISPDAQRFVFGTTWTLRARDANNRPIWHREMGDVWALNITGDGRYVVAAYDDGTIRWHQLQNGGNGANGGKEVMALMVLNKDDESTIDENANGDDNANGYDWVAWTPEGFFTSTPEAFGVLRWHVNDKTDKYGFGHADPTDSIPGLRRPDVLPHVLETMDTLKAVGIAVLAAARESVGVSTGAKPPGHRLLVLAIGINYDESSSLHLQYADKDAADLASSLNDTQGKGSGLYAYVIPPHYLNNANANHDAIIQTLSVMQGEMQRDDVAVVMFSGHGTLIDQNFYFLPYDVNVLTGVENRAIPAAQFRTKIGQLAAKGPVLVLLDACHSGMVADDQAQVPKADVMQSQIYSSNITVLTSSSGKEVSREDPGWGHGAFTKVLLDAFSHSRDVDTNHDGLITVNELADYLNRNLDQLTNSHQTLGISNHFVGNIFVAGR